MKLDFLEKIATINELKQNIPSVGRSWKEGHFFALPSILVFTNLEYFV